MQVLNTLIKSAFFYPAGTHSRWKAQQSSTLQWPVCSATRCTASTPPDWAVALFSPTTGGWRELPMCWMRERSHRSMWPLSFALRIPSNVVKVSDNGDFSQNHNNDTDMNYFPFPRMGSAWNANWFTLCIVIVILPNISYISSVFHSGTEGLRVRVTVKFSREENE